MVNYTEIFKRKVINLIGSSRKDIIELLDEGSPLIGTILQENAERVFHPKDIIDAYEKRTKSEIYKQAKRALEFKILYNEWLDNYRKHKSK